MYLNHLKNSIIDSGLTSWVLTSSTSIFPSSALLRRLMSCPQSQRLPWRGGGWVKPCIWEPELNLCSNLFQWLHLAAMMCMQSAASVMQPERDRFVLVPKKTEPGCQFIFDELASDTRSWTGQTKGKIRAQWREWNRIAAAGWHLYSLGRCLLTAFIASFIGFPSCRFVSSW